jgi:oxygen-independent coproporphyrinogen-3 oxidase
MSRGIYVHIPYCQRRCSYCDFATFELDLKKNGYLEPKEYVDLLCQEIQARGSLWADQHIKSIYFGGGTPSLVPTSYIEHILNTIRSTGIIFDPLTTEVTIEINPETLSSQSLDAYIKMGINRFSVGAQTFHPKILKSIGRDHDPSQIVATLKLLKERELNYTFDLLFALPQQTLEDLNKDLDIICEFSPKHLSAYCLTVPSGHPLESGRPPEDHQVEMFGLISSRLSEVGLKKYEISNFAVPGFESKHNLLYWQDEDYLGVGLSAHSHLLQDSYGVRFWNPKTFSDYKEMVLQGPSLGNISEHSKESLSYEEALTDFCHVSLRLTEGLNMDKLRYRFGEAAASLAVPRLHKLEKMNLLLPTENGFTLTAKGELLSNQVFQELLFSK